MPKKKQKPSKFLQMYLDLVNDNLDTEEWKPINLGDTIMYEISNHGRVRRYDNKYIINPFHSYRKDNDGNFLLNRPTYLRVQLYYYEDGIRKKKHCEISRLVALYFIPIPQRYIDMGYTADTLEVNHIKGGYEIYNNFVSNLEWCTTQENINKAEETGLRHPPSGMNHHSVYLTTDDVIFICDSIEKGIGVKKTYENMNKNLYLSHIEYKKFKPCFYNIKYKKSWTFISQYYNF